MDTGIIISLILGGASVISSICFGLVPNLKREKVEILKKRIRQKNEDLDFFFAEENLLLDQLCKATGENKKSKKNSVRQVIQSQTNRALNSCPSKIQHELQNL